MAIFPKLTSQATINPQSFTCCPRFCDCVNPDQRFHRYDSIGTGTFGAIGTKRIIAPDRSMIVRRVFDPGAIRRRPKVLPRRSREFKVASMYERSAWIKHRDKNQHASSFFILVGCLLCMTGTGCMSTQSRSVMSAANCPAVLVGDNCSQSSGPGELLRADAGQKIILASSNSPAHWDAPTTDPTADYSVNATDPGHHSPTLCPETSSDGSATWCPSCPPRSSIRWCAKTALCCLDNPCQMPGHYSYQPVCHGSYFFAPYNATTVLKQKDYAQDQNHDPRQPYVSTVFEDVYDRVSRERDAAALKKTFRARAHKLPSLEDALNGQS